MKKLLFTLAAICAVAAVYAQGEILRLNLKKGDVFNQKTNTVAATAQNMFGQQIEMNIEMTGELRYEVTDVQDGNYVMDVAYVKLAMSMNSPMAQMDMSGSSETPDADDPFSPMLSAMAGKTFRMTMTPAGRILNVEGMDKIFEAISEQSSAGSLPPEASEQIMNQVKESYGGESFKSNFENGMATFPETRVAVGDSWTAESRLKSVIDLDLKIKYTLVAKNADYVLITAESEIETGGASAEMNGIKARFDLTGNMSSEIRLNPKTLWTESSENAMKMEGMIVIPKSEQVPMDMKIPMKMETVTSIESF